MMNKIELDKSKLSIDLANCRFEGKKGMYLPRTTLSNHDNQEFIIYFFYPLVIAENKSKCKERGGCGNKVVGTTQFMREK